MIKNKYERFNCNIKDLTKFQRSLVRKYNNEYLEDIENNFNVAIKIQNIDKIKALWYVLYHKYKLYFEGKKIRMKK